MRKEKKYKLISVRKKRKEEGGRGERRDER